MKQKPTPNIRSVEDYPDAPWDKIEVGDSVRSFDFPDHHRDLVGEHAHYVEGFVIAIVHWQGSDRYKIQVTGRVWAGSRIEVTEDFAEVLPPVNGTPTLLGSVCNGVVKVITN